MFVWTLGHLAVEELWANVKEKGEGGPSHGICRKESGGIEATERVVRRTAAGSIRSQSKKFISFLFKVI